MSHPFRNSVLGLPLHRLILISPDRKSKRGSLLTAFCKGDLENVERLLSDIPDFAKINIPTIIKEFKNVSTRISPLSAAIIHGNYHLCRKLVEDGASLSGDFEKNLGPLCLALHKKHSDIAELLIELGADVNKLDNDGNTYPLFWAIKEKHPPHVIEHIIAAGFPVNAFVTRKEKMTAIQWAAVNNNVEAIKTLLKYPVDLNVVNSLGETAVIIAVRNNYPEIVELLLKKGASIHNRNASMSPLFLAIRFEHLKVVELLLDMGADIQEGWVSNEIVPPLQFAISYLNLDIVMLLISRGADVKARLRGSHETALHVVATYLGYKLMDDKLRSIQVKIAKALIEKGADVNAKDVDGKTPLDGAICSENTELCKLLLREGAEILGTGWIRGDGILSNRFEYITCVSAFRCPELIKLCLERGGDFNFRDRHGLTPYHCVMAKHNIDMVKAFWQHGCPYDQPELKPGKMKEMLWYEPDLRDKRIFGIQTEFMAGIKNNKLESVIQAIKKGAEPKGCSTKVPLTLHYVAANGNHKIARVLLENGVAINKINKKGQTPLHIAVEKKNMETCKVLLQYGACFDYCSKNTAKNKTKELVQENDQLHQLFKIIYKSFKLTKKGDEKVLRILHEYKKSKEEEMIKVLMNCVNSKGLTLMGVALAGGLMDLAKDLMMFRVEHM